jgi:hypothetical protein
MAHDLSNNIQLAISLLEAMQLRIQRGATRDIIEPVDQAAECRDALRADAQSD